MDNSKNRFPLVMKSMALGCAVLTVIFAVLQIFFPRGWLLATAITFGTAAYHFLMRLLVGALVPNTFDHRRKWFQTTPWETAFYNNLNIKRWKVQVPTYNPSLFSLKDNTLAQVIANMCQAEVVHEIIIVCSFVPLLFSLIWDSFAVFLITSVLAAAFDSLFVMLQRYNRPRLVRLMDRQKRSDLSR